LTSIRAQTVRFFTAIVNAHLPQDNRHVIQLFVPLDLRLAAFEDVPRRFCEITIDEKVFLLIGLVWDTSMRCRGQVHPCIHSRQNCCANQVVKIGLQKGFDFKDDLRWDALGGPHSMQNAFDALCLETRVPWSANPANFRHQFDVLEPIADKQRQRHR
jgi:hypothetical protein